jgi:Wzt C-terminal domain
VTHDMSAVQRFCDRALLLERGELVEIGESDHVANRYLELNFGVTNPLPEPEPEPEPEPAGEEAERGERFGDGRARILDSWFEDEHGQRLTTVASGGGELVYCQRVAFLSDVLDPVFSVLFENPGGAVVLTLDAGNRGNETGLFRTGEDVVVRLRFANVLAPDRYRITPAVGDNGGLRQIDRPMQMHELTVTGTRFSPGVVDIPFELEFDRSTEQVR